MHDSHHHTQDISTISITGLENSSYIDKVNPSPAKLVSSKSDALTITTTTDRIFTPVNGPSAPVIVKEGGKSKLRIVRDNLSEVVVWNPWTGCTNIADFGPDDRYKNMVCVEPGSVAGWAVLEAGETWEGGQRILLG